MTSNSNPKVSAAHSMPPPPRKKSSVQAMRPKTVSAQSAPDSTEGAVEEAAEEADSTDDLEQKISELQASGWRPPEETQDSYEDDDYNDVDLLSDNEEEAGHLRRREEQLLFAEEHFSPAAERDLARRLSLSSQGSNDSDLAYTHFNDTFLFTSDTPWSQSFHHLHPDNLVDYGNVFNDDDAVEQPTPSARRESEDSFAAQRRVRFEEDENAASDSDSTDSDPDEDLFPDLFVQQDQLDAGFRADIEADVQDLYMDDESETGSCWDFDADEARILMMGASNNDDSSDSEASSAGSSGYESEDGDTTDEEEIELPPKKQQQLAEKAAESDANNTPRPAKTPLSATRSKVAKKPTKLVQPKRGVFILDPHKPILTVDCEKGKPDKIRIWPATRPTGQDKAFWRSYFDIESESTSRAASPRMSMSMQMTPTDDSDSNHMPSRNMSIDSGSMMDGFFDQNGKLIQDQVIGPMEAFLPFMEASRAGSLMPDGSSFDDGFHAESGADEETDPLASFVDFGEDDEDEDMPDDSDHLSSPQKFPHLTSQSSNGSSGGFDLLAHLDRRRGVVGSFRRNQQIARHVGSLPSHPALRASASESNAMQSGRRAAANTPITPLRKKKGVRAVGVRNSPITSPLTKDALPKRKGPLKGGFSR